MNRAGKALVLSGGGNRGALQVGALQALFETGYRPDMLVGTSAGAINAAFLATDPAPVQVEHLAHLWRHTTKQDVYPGSRLTMLWRTLRGEESFFSNENLRQFLQANSPPEIKRFGDLTETRLYIVAARRMSATARVFGDDPDEPILDALMASSAIVPLLPPWCYHEECLVDGGLVANLPVSVALARGATDVYAIRVAADADALPQPAGVLGIATQTLLQALTKQAETEIERLRTAGGHLITVQGFELLPPWNYEHTEEMITSGYRQARAQLAHAQRERTGWIRRLLGHLKTNNEHIATPAEDVRSGATP